VFQSINSIPSNSASSVQAANASSAGDRPRLAGLGVDGVDRVGGQAGGDVHARQAAGVMTGGTDGSYNPDPFAFPERRVEVFRPPYLFRESRPRITKAPETIRPGTVFTIETPDAAAVQTVTLIRATSVTHSFNMDQRCVRLEIRTRYEHRLELEAPPDSYVAPPGHYLLHVLDQTGVPSEAVIVRLGR